MSIKLIDKQKGKYTLLIHGIECVFMPMDLYIGNNLFPAKAFVPKGKSVIKWKINGKQISYNQIRKQINSLPLSPPQSNNC